MQITETLIRDVVAQVLAEVGRTPAVGGRGFAGRNGVFDCVDEAAALKGLAAFEYWCWPMVSSPMVFAVPRIIQEP